MHDYICEKRERKLTQENSLNHSTFLLPLSAFFFFFVCKKKACPSYVTTYNLSHIYLAKILYYEV